MQRKFKNVKIKLVILDLDGTIWDHLDISSLNPPFKVLNDNLIADSKGVKVRLCDGVRELLETIKNSNLLLSIASWNIRDVAIEALKAFNILEYFIKPKIEPHPRKDIMILKLLAELKSEGLKIKPEEILYVDDRDIHLKGILRNVGKVRFVHMWKDVQNHYELINMILNLI